MFYCTQKINEYDKFWNYPEVQDIYSITEEELESIKIDHGFIYKSERYTCYFYFRTENALKKSGITTMKELVSMTEKDLIHIRGIGKKCLEEIKEVLRDIFHLSLKKGGELHGKYTVKDKKKLNFSGPLYLCNAHVTPLEHPCNTPVIQNEENQKKDNIFSDLPPEFNLTTLSQHQFIR